MSDYAVEWVDGRGRSRWQPITPDGESPWLVSDYINGAHRAWRAQAPDFSLFGGFPNPVTYKSKARAERIARRRQARQEAKALRRIHPVQKRETES